MNNFTNPCPPKAYKNAEFLASPAARLIRIQTELMEPAQRFEKEGIHNTIVIFGSARTLPENQAAENLTAAEKALAADPNSADLQKRLRIAKSSMKFSPFYKHTQDLAHELTTWTLKEEDPNRRFHIISGGGPGIMQAANQGAMEAGGKSIGLGISLPFEQGLNPYCTEELSFEFHYFFIRKYWFLYHAKAIVVMPGGFGTMDELFEMLTLIQTKKIHKKIPILLFGKEFWNSLINFETLIEWGTISEEDLELFQIVDSVEEAATILESKLSQCTWNSKYPSMCAFPPGINEI